MSEQQMRRMANNSSVPVVQLAADDFTEEVTIDVMELVYNLLSHWKLIISVALVLAFITGIVTFFLITPQYQATSTIYVLSRRDSAINMSDLQIGSALTSDYIKVFNMWEVHEEVISNLDLPYDYRQIQKKLSVVNTSNTRMLDISFTSTSAEEAAMVANEYASVVSQYIADTMSTDKPNIMSVALTPTRPVSPHKLRNIALGFILGAIIAMVIVTVQFLMDDKYKTADDIRKYTGLTTLAIVPVEDIDDKKARRASKSARRE